VVGKDTRIMKAQHKTFAEIVGDFSNKPSSQNNKTGYSCLGFCAALYKALNKDWPEVWNGLTIDNYQETIKTRSPFAQETLLKLASDIGTEVNPNEVVAGDFVIVKTHTGEMFPAVCVGNGNIVSSFEYCGVKVMKLDKEKGTIFVARRL